MRPILDNPFDTALLTLGLSVGLLCFLFIIAHLIAYRNDGTSRLGLQPIQSALLNYLVTGRPNPLVPWQWYDWVFLLGVSLGIMVTGWWLDVGGILIGNPTDPSYMETHPDVEVFWLYVVDGVISLIFCALIICFDNAGHPRRWLVRELGRPMID